MIKIKYPVFNYFLIISLFTLLTTSCESLKKDPDYIGTWQFTEQITTDNLVYNTTRTLKLTKNTYEETYVIQRENSTSISEIYGMKGSLGLTHTYLEFTLEELGTCAVDNMDKCTGNVNWYGEGTSYWTNNFQYRHVEKAFRGEYEVTKNTMVLTRDMNNDGDIEDTGEDITFEMI